MIFKICCPVVVQQVLHSFKINIVTCPGNASKITVIVSHYCNEVLFFCKKTPPYFCRKCYIGQPYQLNDTNYDQSDP